jgi:hypothetical protein
LAEDVGGQLDGDLVHQKLGIISKLISEKLEAEKALEKLNEEAKKISDRIKYIGSDLVPTLFDELGLSKVSLSDGTGVAIKTDYNAAITEEKKADCFAWLAKNKLDTVIKNKIDVELKKDDLAHSKELTTLLKKLRLKFTEKKSVHPQTLKALVREQIVENTSFPQDLFSVYKYRETIILK